MQDVYIEADGSVRGIYDDETAEALAALGIADVRRASHVEPLGPGWVADMAPVGGPLLWAAETEGTCVPFATRADALAAETAWLTSRLDDGSLTRN